MQDIRQLKAKVIQTALDMAAVQSWSDISLYAIAQAAYADIEDIQILFPEKNDILTAFHRQIDERLEVEIEAEGQQTETPRDRLFDIIMARFDLLNESRAGVVSILNAVTLDPKAAVLSIPSLYHSVSHMMALAGMEGGAMKTTALCGLYLKILRDWIHDDTPDMAATMASVDKALGWLERC